ncbi:MAG: thioredoxin family protein [Desulfotignum sp.]
MINKTDAARLRAWADKQAHTHTIFLSKTRHLKQPGFEAFASDLAQAAPCIRIVPSGRETRLPTFFVTDNIGFSALPMERELSPFLETLSCRTGLMPPLADDLAMPLEKMHHPCRLTLFIAPECPHCPHMVQTLVSMAVRAKQIVLEIIDGSLFPETAREHNIMSVPCLIVDQGARWTGQADPEEILTLISERDLSQLSTDSFRKILEQGNAAWVCRQMIRAGTVFENFFTLLLHPVWSVRLGALVVVETLVQEAPELAALLCPHIIQAFDGADVSVQGDLLYALGEAGNPDTCAWIITKMPGLAHPDLVDAAREALTAIEKRR